MLKNIFKYLKKIVYTFGVILFSYLLELNLN